MKTALITALVFMMAGAVSPVQAEDALPEECGLLPAHKPQDGVAYQPGVDVHGNDVVPADLNAAPIKAPERIIVPLSIDLKDRLEHNDIQGVELDAQLGLLEIYEDGRVTYDGKNLTPELYALCGKGAPVPLAADAGQDAINDIKSDAVEIAPVEAVPPQSVVIEGGEFREEGYK